MSNNERMIRKLNSQLGKGGKLLAEAISEKLDNWFQNLPRDTQMILKGFGLACIIFFIIWIL